MSREAGDSLAHLENVLILSKVAARQTAVGGGTIGFSRHSLAGLIIFDREQTAGLLRALRLSGKFFALIIENLGHFQQSGSSQPFRYLAHRSSECCLVCLIEVEEGIPHFVVEKRYGFGKEKFELTFCDLCTLVPFLNRWLESQQA